MKKAFKIMGDTIKVFILFTGCTLLFYYGMMWLHNEYEEHRQYDAPEGTAVQASTMEETTDSWFNQLIERWEFFYYNGE